jgi:hypothetical protein
MNAPAELHPPVPSQGLVESLDARLWLDHTIDGHTFSPCLVTHPAGEAIEPTQVELTMRGVAAALGATPSGPTMPQVDVTVLLHPDSRLLLSFSGTPYRIPVAKHPRWSNVLGGLGFVLLAVGMVELSPAASPMEVDEYVESVGAAGLLYFAAARINGGAK